MDVFRDSVFEVLDSWQFASLISTDYIIFSRNFGYELVIPVKEMAVDSLIQKKAGFFFCACVIDSDGVSIEIYKFVCFCWCF